MDGRIRESLFEEGRSGESSGEEVGWEEVGIGKKVKTVFEGMMEMRWVDELRVWS